MEEMLKQILDKLDNMATKQDIFRIEKKLDTIMEHVAQITEAQTTIKSELITHEHSIDVIHRNQLRIETEVNKLKQK